MIFSLCAQSRCMAIFSFVFFQFFSLQVLFPAFKHVHLFLKVGEQGFFFLPELFLQVPGQLAAYDFLGVKSVRDEPPQSSILNPQSSILTKTQS